MTCVIELRDSDLEFMALYCTAALRALEINGNRQLAQGEDRREQLHSFRLRETLVESLMDSLLQSLSEVGMADDDTLNAVGLEIEELVDRIREMCGE